MEMEKIDNFKGEYEFLSNFYVNDDGKCIENLYQAAKTDDPEWQAKLLTAETPSKAKKLGRKCPVRATWNDEKIEVMRGLVWNKFLDIALADKLLATGDAHLEEGNWWGDTFWGVCKGKGENWLGKILMEVREKLRTPVKVIS